MRVAGLPDLLLLPFVTDHYLKEIRRFLYQQVGAPACLEIDLTIFLEENGAGESFVGDLEGILPDLLRHGELASEVGLSISG